VASPLADGSKHGRQFAPKRGVRQARIVEIVCQNMDIQLGSLSPPGRGLG
jgi:hypothetical protein